jgi:hypothetical protein
MSIYASLHEFSVRRFGDEHDTRLWVQGVPGHIDYTGPEWQWLPPPIEDLDGGKLRAVVVVEVGSAKGTERCGQEYVDPLLILSGQEWEQLSFDAVMRRIEQALDQRRGPRPIALVLAPDGTSRWVYPEDQNRST